MSTTRNKKRKPDPTVDTNANSCNAYKSTLHAFILLAGRVVSSIFDDDDEDEEEDDNKEQEEEMIRGASNCNASMMVVAAFNLINMSRAFVSSYTGIVGVRAIVIGRMMTEPTFAKKLVMAAAAAFAELEKSKQEKYSHFEKG
jgi:hypothetical protein